MKTQNSFVLLLILLGWICQATRAQAENQLIGKAAMLYRQSARESRFFEEAEALHPQVIPTQTVKARGH